jgi:hypothetical protein
LPVPIGGLAIGGAGSMRLQTGGLTTGGLAGQPGASGTCFGGDASWEENTDGWQRTDDH